MEASVALDLVIQLHKLGIGVKFIVSGDDSTMRAYLHHIGTIKNAKRPLDLPKTSFYVVYLTV